MHQCRTSEHSFVTNTTDLYSLKCRHYWSHLELCLCLSFYVIIIFLFLVMLLVCGVLVVQYMNIFLCPTWCSCMSSPFRLWRTDLSVLFVCSHYPAQCAVSVVSKCIRVSRDTLEDKIVAISFIVRLYDAVLLQLKIIHFW